MTIGTRYYTPSQFEIDANGVPLAAARLYFYATGTTTPQDTYKDVSCTIPNANPVVADANGRFGNIWLSPANAYKVQLWTPATVDDPTGSQIWSFDPVGPASGGAVSNVAGIIGEIRAFGGLSSAIPANWYQCYGQAVSRTTYADAFAVLGTTWGAGDGSTTFNLPDFRGRAPFGLDNMGGLAANRVTSGVSGIAGTSLGASGGDQNVQQHTHSVNDPQHSHGITDPQHKHAAADGSLFDVSGSGSSFGSGPTSGLLQKEFTADASTGITINDASTGITNANYGTGSSANMPPAAIVYFIIYLGA